MVVVLVLAAGAGWESAAVAGLADRPDVVVLKRCVDVADLIATAAAGQADVAVVGLDAPGLDTAAVDHLRGYGVRTVAVLPGGADRDAVLLAATRIGVRSTLADDALEELGELVTADDRVPDVPSEQPEVALPPPRHGRLVAVWGPAGAPGRTTVAVGLAAEIGRHHRTVLVDADPYGGAVAQQLGVVDEVSGLLAAARLVATGQLEERFAGVPRSLDHRFSVVTGLPRPDRWPEIRPGVLERLLEVAQGHGHVVVDTGFCLEDDLALDPVGGRTGRNRMTLAGLAAADEVVVVGSADPVGLSRLARGLVELAEVGPPAPVRVLVNRMRPTLGWSERDIVRMLHTLVPPERVHFLPDDRAGVDRALLAGRTLQEVGDSALTRALAGVVAELGVRQAANSR
ncbi:AAA family ATPase [Nocardioides sp. GXQ0305]|uniref:AAA family ATPase n=1 Tax=Nocardioides sp. GXQ0305 TaxID=3423912 RepID=UPI003D7D365F